MGTKNWEKGGIECDWNLLMVAFTEYVPVSRQWPQMGLHCMFKFNKAGPVSGNPASSGLVLTKTSP